MADEEDSTTQATEHRHVGRLQLVWDVVVFQFKLAADGIRDVLLVPLSILTAILGLAAGGDEPDRYFKQLLKFGRQTEAWLDLFGQGHGEATSDRLIQPLQERVIDGARSNPWLSRAGTRINQRLDSVNASVAGSAKRSQTESKSDS